MKNYVLLLCAMMTAAILQACAAEPQRPRPDWDKIHTLHNQDCTGAQDCFVKIMVPDFSSHTSAYPDNVSVTIKQGKKSQIFWMLPVDATNPAASCYFYSHAGDGVFYKNFLDDIDDFSDQGPVEAPKPNPKPSPLQAQWYYWFSKNQTKKDYLYRVVFHCGNDPIPFVIDPAIFNEGP